jgi:membrane protein required for colicin V production
MGLDALSVIVLGLFAGFGALRGAVAGLLSLCGLALGYAAAVFAAGHYGAPVAELTGLPELAGVALAGTLAFAVTSAAFGLFAVLLRRCRVLGSGRESSPRDRFLGAVFGGLRGALIVVLLGVLAGWVDALRSTGVAPALPELGDSLTARASASAVEVGLGAALSDSPAGPVVARVVARPARSLAGFQELVEHPSIGALQGDAMFWSYVEHGNVEAAMNRMSFISIAGDEAFRGELAALGLIDESAAGDPAQFREAVGAVLGELGPRLHAIREDPEFQELIEDPDVLDHVAQGNTLALLGNARFRQVVARVASAD